jgi:DNA-directed RNA polymerase subunit RPC12/RpoP
MYKSWADYNQNPPTIQEILADPGLLTCLRCGWAWWRRQDDLPVQCPHCKSGSWSMPRKHYVCPHCRRFGGAKDCLHCAQLRRRAVEDAEGQGRLCCPRCRRFGPVPNCRACDWLNDPAPANEPVGSAPAGDGAG